jgi:hypothetical protein
VWVAVRHLHLHCRLSTTSVRGDGVVSIFQPSGHAALMLAYTMRPGAPGSTGFNFRTVTTARLANVVERQWSVGQCPGCRQLSVSDHTRTSRMRVHRSGPWARSGTQYHQVGPWKPCRDAGRAFLSMVRVALGVTSSEPRYCARPLAFEVPPQMPLLACCASRAGCAEVTQLHLVRLA